MASLPDDRIDLARGALLIAKAAYPDLDESFYLGRLNCMAAGLMNQITAKMMIAARSFSIIWAKPVPLIRTGWSRSAGRSF
jgi:hypothetical protein